MLVKHLRVFSSIRYLDLGQGWQTLGVFGPAYFRRRDQSSNSCGIAGLRVVIREAVIVTVKPHILVTVRDLSVTRPRRQDRHRIEGGSGEEGSRKK